MQDGEPLRATRSTLRFAAAKVPAATAADPTLGSWLQRALTFMDDSDDVMECGYGKLKFSVQPPLRGLEEGFVGGDVPPARRMESQSGLAALDRFVTLDATHDALEAFRKDPEATAAHASAIAATWAAGRRAGAAADLGAWAGAVCAHGHAYRQNAQSNHGTLLASTILLDWVLSALRFGALRGLSGVDDAFDRNLNGICKLLVHCVVPMSGMMASVCTTRYTGGGIWGAWSIAYLFHLSHAFHAFYMLRNMLDDSK